MIWTKHETKMKKGATFIFTTSDDSIILHYKIEVPDVVEGRGFLLFVLFLNSLCFRDFAFTSKVIEALFLGCLFSLTLSLFNLVFHVFPQNFPEGDIKHICTLVRGAGKDYEGQV